MVQGFNILTLANWHIILYRKQHLCFDTIGTLSSPAPMPILQRFLKFSLKMLLLLNMLFIFGR